MRRLGSDLVWDGQVNALRTGADLETDYLARSAIRSLEALRCEVIARSMKDDMITGRAKSRIGRSTLCRTPKE